MWGQSSAFRIPLSAFEGARIKKIHQLHELGGECGIWGHELKNYTNYTN